MFENRTQILMIKEICLGIFEPYQAHRYISPYGFHLRLLCYISAYSSLIGNPQKKIVSLRQAGNGLA